MSSKLLHPVKGWLPGEDMVWLPCPHGVTLLSSPAQDLLVIHKHQLVTSSLWQSWAPNISGLISTSGPEPCSCPAEISAEATWELWDEVWRDEEHSTPWMKVMAQGWRQLAQDCMCLLCPASSVLIILSDYKGPTKGCSWALQWGNFVNSPPPLSSQYGLS